MLQITHNLNDIQASTSIFFQNAPMKMFSIILIGLHKAPQFLKKIDLMLMLCKTIVAHTVLQTIIYIASALYK